MASRVTLDSEGYFHRDGERVIPVGANYWPGSCGVEMWQRWPEEEVRADLDLLLSLGLNTVRFFVRWQDFEPEPGRYDERMFERLARLLAWCSERSLLAHPSLFVGWMSGGVFWPPWKQERSLFADPYMVERSVAFASRAAQTIAPHAACVLAIDQGNELCCLSDSHQAPPSAVREWCRLIGDAVREACPGVLLVSGNDHNQVVADTGWRLGDQPGCDLASMHAYPVPAWHPVGFDGMTDPFCQSLLPFYTQVARAFGPVLVQEFGTIATFGEREQDAYLRAVLPAARDAGANGFLWWCLRDLPRDVFPYSRNAFESTLGLVDAEGRVKPGLGAFVEFCRALPGRLAAPPAAREVGLYLPRHYYHREAPRNPGNTPERLSRRLLVANHLLRALGHATRVVRGDRPLDGGPPALVITGAALDSHEVTALDSWVRDGGRLVWHGVDWRGWDHALGSLLGAHPTDYRSAQPVQLDFAGDRWTLTGWPGAVATTVQLAGARIVAVDERGRPAVLAREAGRGRVACSLPFVEDSPAAVAADRTARDRWTAWYEGMLRLVYDR